MLLLNRGEVGSEKAVSLQNIVCRFADPRDMDSVIEFALMAINDNELPSFALDVGEDLAERIRKGGSENIVIAEDPKMDSRIVGYLELDPQRTRKGKAFYIRGIYVLPEYRGQGIASKMISLMREKLCCHGEQLRVEALTENELRFWRKLGFKIHHYSLYLPPEE